MSRNLTSCTIHDDLERVAHVMWERDLGCLPVIDDRGCVAGMITDRDLCLASYKHAMPLRTMVVRDVMAKQIVSCTAHDKLEVIGRRMGRYQVRRLPVIDDRGRPIGIVSLNDFARAATAGDIPAFQVTATMVAVCSPRPLIAAGL